MPKVIVRKCRWTGKFFDNDKAFAKHLKKRRVELHSEIRMRRAIAVIDKVWAEIRQIDNIPDIMQAFWDNHHILAWRGYHMNRHYVKKLPEKIVELESLSYTLRYADNVTISHSAPIGKIHNWCGHLCHRDFPGFIGNISVVYKSDYGEAGLSNTVGGFARQATGFNTGSGGGGYRGLTYELRIYLDDFPNLKKRIEEECVFRRLTDSDWHLYSERHNAKITG